MHATAPSANLPDIFRAACSAIAQLDTGMPITPPSTVRTRPSLFTAALADIQRSAATAQSAGVGNGAGVRHR